MLINGCPCLFLKQFTTENTEVTEFYFVNCAAGAVNNTKLFSVSSVTSVVKCLLAVGRTLPAFTINVGCISVGSAHPTRLHELEPVA